MAIQTKTRAVDDGRVTVSFSDSIDLVKTQVQFSPKGVSLLTKWPFRVGAEVEFAFDHRGQRHCCTGVVVACHRLRRPLGFYETVLYFVETPCSELQKAASACQLAREKVGAGGAHVPPSGDHPIAVSPRSQNRDDGVPITPEPALELPEPA
jgi:hypothetical protein